jgi:hypothetical protein
MPVNHTLTRQLAAQAGEEEFLTVNIVMPAMGDTAEGTASFARLLFGLTALALERFGAVTENHCQDALREYVPSSRPGTPVDPFDGQLLRFCGADGGYQFHSIGPDLTEAPGGKGDLALTVVGSAQGSLVEDAQSQAASNP